MKQNSKMIPLFAVLGQKPNPKRCFQGCCTDYSRTTNSSETRLSTLLELILAIIPAICIPTASNIKEIPLSFKHISNDNTKDNNYYLWIIPLISSDILADDFIVSKKKEEQIIKPDRDFFGSFFPICHLHQFNILICRLEARRSYIATP